jgi:hypothetical protein
MALGKPTIAYIRADLVEAAGPDLPIVNATIETIEAKLHELIVDRERRCQLALRSREYFEKTHASDRVCRGLLDIYKAAFSDEKPIDWAGVSHFLDRQTAESEAHGAKRALQGLTKKKGLLDPPMRKIPARLLRRLLGRPA